MLFRDIIELLGRIHCRDYHFVTNDRSLEAMKGDWFLQVEAERPDRITGIISPQRGRKWRLTSHMTKSEICQTAFAAVVAFSEHEIRESFTYFDEPVYSPHHDVEALLTLCTQSKPDARHNLRLHNPADSLDAAPPLETPECFP